MGIPFDQDALAGILPRGGEGGINLHINVEVCIADLLSLPGTASSAGVNASRIIPPGTVISRWPLLTAALLHRRRYNCPQAGVQSCAVKIVSHWRLSHGDRTKPNCGRGRQQKAEETSRVAAKNRNTHSRKIETHPQHPRVGISPLNRPEFYRGFRQYATAAVSSVVKSQK